MRIAINVLCADDDDSSRRVVAECLASEGFLVELAQDGSEAWDALARPDAPSIAVLDWCMPGLSGVEICRRLRERGSSRYTYILLLSALSDREHVTGGLSSGADGYIVKPFDLDELVERVRAGQRVVESHEGLRAEHESHSAQLAALSVTDELTGLHNRRGFVSLAEAHARLALRREESFAIVFMDLNGLKAINDYLGHEAGDEALREAGEFLKRTMPEADIVARLGGDEFVALLDCEPDSVKEVFDRVERELEALCSAPGRRYRLSLSVGAAFFDPGDPRPIEELLGNADHNMYQHKRHTRNRKQSIVLGLSAPPEMRQSLAPPSRRSLRVSSFRWPAGGNSKLLDHLLSAWILRRPDASAHAQRIGTYTGILARALGASIDEATVLAQLATLHDIGELMLPDAVLESNGRLSPEDIALKRRHSTFGGELLAGVEWSFCRSAASIALHHHERWDGSGYPNGLVGDQCPREARIVGILDAYDNRKHPHAAGEDPTDAEIAEYFRKERAKRFDPMLVDALLDTLGELRMSLPAPSKLPSFC